MSKDQTAGAPSVDVISSDYVEVLPRLPGEAQRTMNLDRDHRIAIASRIMASLTSRNVSLLKPEECASKGLAYADALLALVK